MYWTSAIIHSLGIIKIGCRTRTHTHSCCWRCCWCCVQFVVSQNSLAYWRDAAVVRVRSLSCCVLGCCVSVGGFAVSLLLVRSRMIACARTESAGWGRRVGAVGLGRGWAGGRWPRARHARTTRLSWHGVSILLCVEWFRKHVSARRLTHSATT